VELIDIKCCDCSLNRVRYAIHEVLHLSESLPLLKTSHWSMVIRQDELRARGYRLLTIAH
jgi:hypothetical protein